MKSYLCLTGVSYATVFARNADEAEEIFSQHTSAKLQEIMPYESARHFRGVFGDCLGTFSMLTINKGEPA